jgi:hypothetical protein
LALSAAHPPRALQCPRCRAPLPEFTVRPDEETCASCGVSFSAVAFAPPAPVVRLPAVAFANDLGATPCSRHPNHAAVANCSRCGVFICELCRIPLDGQELCPDCFDRMSRQGALAAVETHFFDASGLAIALAIFGWITCWFGLVLGPAAVVLAAKGLRQKRAWREVGGRGGPIFAIFMGVLLTLFSLALIAMMFAGAAGIAPFGGGRQP